MKGYDRMAMHKDFAEWYRAGGLEPDGDILPKRWDAVASFESDRDDLVHAAKLFYRMGQPDSEFLKEFRASFQGKDPAFKMRDNDVELAVLAGAHLIYTMETYNEDGWRELVALLLVCGAAQNLRQSPTVPEIPGLAAVLLAKAATWRDRLGEGRKPDKASEEMTTKDLTEKLNQVEQKLSAVAEESNILWWLISEQSRDEKKRWDQVPIHAAALMSAKELADLVRIIPGPPAAIAFLDRIIHLAKPKASPSASIKDAVISVEGSWAERQPSPPQEILTFLPVSFAIRSFAETKGNQTLLQVFPTSIGFAADAKIPVGHLAYQLYLELLLWRHWKKMEQK